MDESTRNQDTTSLFLNQIDELYTNLGYTTAAVALLSSFLTWILWPVAAHAALLAWYGGALLLALGGVLLSLMYRRTPIHQFNAPHWLKLYLAGTLLAGLCWGALPLFVVPTAATIHLLAAIFITAGLVTGSAATLAGLKFGFAVFSLPAMLPGALYLVYQDQQPASLIGLFTLAFLGFIVFIALRIHRTLYYSLRRQVEVSTRLSLLEIEKIELEHKVDMLRHQLGEEQAELLQLRAVLRHQGNAAPALRRANELLDQRFAALMDELNGGVWDMNMRTGEVHFGKGWLAMLGHDQSDERKHMAFWENSLHPDDRLAVLNKLHAFAEGSLQQFASSHRLRSKSGEWVWVMARAHGVIWGSFGEVLNIVGMELHVPESGAAAARSLDLLNFDLNAWLTTQEAFDRRFEQLLRTTSVADIEHSLCCIKLVGMDDFPQGSAALEEISLYEVGRVLLNEFRHGDALLRQDSTSFALLLAFCKPEDAWDKALALQESLRTLQVSYRGQRLALTAGIGITPITAGRDDMGGIMQDAQTACERAIATSPQLVYLYQRDNPALGASILEKQLARRIRDGIGNDSIRLAALPLQPLGKPAAGSRQLLILRACTGAEPGTCHDGADLAAIAGNSPLPTSLDIHVLDKLAAGQGSANSADSIYLYQCAEASCTDARFSAKLLQLLAALPAQGARLCLGIPAQALEAQPAAITQFTRDVKHAGGLVALTHFDNSSALQQLIRLCPVDFLKLDPALLRNLEEDRSSGITVKYINDIIHLAGIRSIAESTTTALAPATLHALQIDFLQPHPATASGIPL